MHGSEAMLPETVVAVIIRRRFRWRPGRAGMPARLPSRRHGSGRLSAEPAVRSEGTPVEKDRRLAPACRHAGRAARFNGGNAGLRLIPSRLPAAFLRHAPAAAGSPGR